MGDVLPTPWGGYLLTSYELCDQVLRSRDWKVLDEGWKTRRKADRWTGFAHQEFNQTLLALNPPHHTRNRRSLGNVFDRGTLSRLHAPLAGAVEALLDELSERLRSGEEVDFVETVGDQLPLAAIGQWLDIPRADYPLLLSLTHDHALCQELLPSASELAAADEAARGLRTYFSALVQDRRKSPGNDVVSSWLRKWDRLEPDRDMADEQVFFLVMLLFIASVETTSTLLPSMVWLLDQHPEQRHWLRDNLHHVPQAVEEVLRFDPPVQVAGRFAAEDTVLAGAPLEKDSIVHVMIASANHDPARTPDPDKFDVRRTGDQVSMHLAFGGGAHYCLGAALARQEATVLLEALLKRLPSMRVSSPPVWRPRVAFRRISALPVVGH